MPAVISVSLYFERRRPIAVGIGMCGTGVGTFVFGPLSQYLLEHMDWKSAHFILGKMDANDTYVNGLTNLCAPSKETDSPHKLLSTLYFARIRLIWRVK